MDDFKKYLMKTDERIANNIYSYSDNKRFMAQRKLLREIMKRYAEFEDTDN